MIWLGLLVVAVLLLFSALNIALQIPLRTHLAEELERRGQSDAFEAFVGIRPQYLLATAVFRSAATLAVLLIALEYAGGSAPQRQTAGTIGAFAASLAIVLVFGFALPNAWAKYSGEWLLVRLMPLLSAVRILCYPLIVVLTVLDPFVRRLAGVPLRDAQSYADQLEQEILNVVSEGERHGAVDEEEKEMIESVMELTDTRVDNIMTPRTEIVAIPADAGLASVLETVRTKGHSRIPVYDQTIDTILGVLYVKDVLCRREDTPFSVSASMRKGLFVPESKHIRDLLREFQERKVHIAIVLDEYGGTAGLVTIEDILEELVGEITDEYETETPAELKRIDENTVEVDARMEIDELNDQLDISLPEDEDYETIGGLVFSTMGKIPEIGEHCEHNNVGIQVIAAEPRRILRLRLKITPGSTQNGMTD